MAADQGPSGARILAIVPALNEEATVATVITSLASYLSIDVLVIDDGSSDATAAVATAAGATVLRHPFNVGVGAALRTGFRYALTRGYEAVIQIDGDGQHDPADAKLLLEPVIGGSADLVIGSRFDGGYEVGTLRRFGMRLLSWRISRAVGVTIEDTTSGFRAFSARAVSHFADRYPRAYLSDTVEALILAGRADLELVEVPVHMRPRMGGTSSSGRLKSLFHLVRINLVLSFHRFERFEA
jgi:glycosyltransferase involved in cell wall biosynthesis